jgi:C4-dicarboxylate transporter DctM subunit
MWNVIGMAVIVLLFAIGAPIWLSLTSGSMVILLLGIGTSSLTIPTQFYSGVDTFTVMAIPFFLFAGNIMAYGGSAPYIFNLVNSLVGNKRGGIPIATILTAMLYAAITGSVAATLTGIRSICLPNMRKAGYSDKFSAGVMCSSSTMGVLIPPSILMIIYGGLAQQNVGTLFVSGIIPGILCGASLIIVAYLRSPSLKELDVAYPAETFSWKNRGINLVKGAPAVLMPLIVLGSIYAGIMTPTESGALSCIYGLIVSLFVYRALKIRTMNGILKDTANSTSMVFLMNAGSALFSLPLTRLGIPQVFARLINNAGLTGTPLVIAIVLIFLVLGCFIDSMPIMFLVLPIVLPALKAARVNLIYFNVITILCMQIGMITPPFGSAMYLTARLIGIPAVEVIKEVTPYLLTMVGFLFLLIFVPWLSLCLV